MLTPFANEPYVRFDQAGPREQMLAALKLVESELGRDYPAIVDGERFTTGEWITSTNPAQPKQIIGRVAKSTPELALKAINAANGAFAEWSRTDPDIRARYLIKAAAILRRRIYEFSAWMVYEVSKSWIEAYADTAEAIDFLEFYAREMMRLGGSHPTTPYPGEENEVRYLGLGVGAVICPWNFPLAIMAGMTCAGIVTGNTVITKPAEQSPVIAAKFFEILEECRIPAGVANFLPGLGEIVGEVLVNHPLTRFIAFTGSRDVGVHIYQKAAIVHPGQKWLKRTILEMGGKDCIIVDDDCDLDNAAEGIVAAAFGFQGQKCSACSRLIVVDRIYDGLLDRVVDRARALTMGNPATEDFAEGAVIDSDSFDKIRGYIEIGHTEGKRVLGGVSSPLESDGYFISPTVFAEVDRNARIAQEEIFGPVLACIRAADFDDALNIANGTDYGLTGGLYTRRRENLERARHDFHVGNLYLNRKCTGALVDVQPFGGFNMSGTDSKAGGRDYLTLFMQGKSVTERW